MSPLLAKIIEIATRIAATPEGQALIKLILDKLWGLLLSSSPTDAVVISRFVKTFEATYKAQA